MLTVNLRPVHCQDGSHEFGSKLSSDQLKREKSYSVWPENKNKHDFRGNTAEASKKSAP